MRRKVRRITGSVLRTLRVTVGRFVQPAFEDRIAALDATIRHVTARGELNAAALEERVESVGRVAAGLAASVAALEEQVESVAGVAAQSAASAATLDARVDSVERSAAEGSGSAPALAERLESLRTETKADVARAVEGLAARVVADGWTLRRGLMGEIDRTRSRLAVPDSEMLALEEYRSSAEYARIFEDPEPLVSVTVATYDRANVLVERCLASLIAQDYRNLEIIVAGDGCTDDTEARVRALEDDRVTYVEVVDRAVPPSIGRGSDAMNLARSLATGDLLTHLDDDDEYTPDRIGRLVRFLQERKAELVWHPFWWQEGSDADWTVNDADAFEFAKVTSGSVLYLGWFKRLTWDHWARRYRAPGDWVLFRTMRDMNIRAVRYPVPLLRHYRERQNPRLQEGPDAEPMPTTATALRRAMPLVPDIDSEPTYAALIEQVSPWRRAMLEIAGRTGLRTGGPLRPVAGATVPTMITGRGYVVRLYGPWRDGADAFRYDVRILRTVARVDGIQVPKLLAQGELTRDWSFTVTTEIPGIPLATVRDQLQPSDLRTVVRWLGAVVRDLHATPLSREEKAQGRDASRALLAERHASLRRTLEEEGALPTDLLARIDDWLPPLADLTPSEDDAVLSHSNLSDREVLGVWHAGRFDPTGVVGLGQALIGHPLQVLSALHPRVFRWDPTLLRMFLLEVGWPDTDRSDFPKLVLAFILLGARARTRDIPGVADAHDLDDLARRLVLGARAEAMG